MAPPWRDMHWVALARHQKAAGEVGVDHGLPALGADGFQRRHELAAGVVDQAVDAAVFGQHGRDQAAHRVFLPDVADLRAGLAAILGDFRRDGLQLVGLAAHQHDARAQCREFMRGAAADAGTAAGDDDDLVLEQRRRKDGLVRHGRFPRYRQAVACWERPSIERASVGLAMARPALRAQVASASISTPLPLARDPSGR
jgi:hypothetical protein